MTNLLILDANLALLFVVGVTKREYIAKHKRLAAYDTTDFDELLKIIEYSTVVFTPNVLTETSNLVRYVKEPIRSEVSAMLAQVIKITSEQMVPSQIAVARSEYLTLGLTDAVLLQVASTGGSLLTTDVGLYLAALNADLNAVNYNNIKDLR